MAPKLHLLLVLAVLGGSLPLSRGFAQTPSPASPPPTAVPGTAAEADVLPGLPRPPDAPQSLLQQPSPIPPYSCDPLPGPYFERDAQLDPPDMPQPGWFTNVDIGIVGPHVKNRLTNMVQIDGAPPATVHVPGADLDWTIAPRIEAGYRLPSGLGDFAFAYRFFASDGTGVTSGLDTIATLRSRLSVNIVDMDYTSREFRTYQCPYVDMRWRFGLRWADAFFDSRAEEPFAAAAGGSGIFETRVSNNFWGLGPHAGLELTRHFKDAGLALVAQIDGATLLGRIRQNFFAASTGVGPDGQFLTGNTRESVSQDVAIITAFFGISWQPPSRPYLHVDAGYQYEYWWNVGRNSSTTSRGELSDQGVLLRAEFNF